MGNKTLNNFLINLTAAFTNSQLYMVGHPLTEKSINKTLSLFEKITVGIDELTIMVVDGELIVKDIQVGKLPSCSSNLARLLNGNGVERLTFTCGLERYELLMFLSAFNIVFQEDSTKASEHIKIGKVKIRRKKLVRDDSKIDMIFEQGGSTAEIAGSEPSYENDQVKSEEAADDDFVLIDKEEFERLQDFYISAKQHKKLNIIGIEDIVGQFIKTFKSELSPLLSMATLKSYDEYTYVHAANVCILTISQAEFMGVDDNVLHDIGIAALVHDVGKTFVPDEILNKAGKLTPEEWDVMMSHPLQGAKYLFDTSGMPRLAILVAFEHHLKYNLTGYPKVPEDYNVHPCSLMVNVADVFDALSTVRPYRKPLSKYEVFEMLRKGAGTEFDPFIVENFIAMMKSAKK